MEQGERQLDGPDGIMVTTVAGDPGLLRFYTGRLAPMLDVDEVRELIAALQEWTEEAP